MPVYSWLDPHRKEKDLFSSWKQLLHDHDKRTLARTDPDTAEDTAGRAMAGDIALDDRTAILSESHRCRQVLAFVPRPNLADLVPGIRSNSWEQGQEQEQEPLAAPMSADAIRTLKQKRQRIKYNSGPRPVIDHFTGSGQNSADAPTNDKRELQQVLSGMDSAQVLEKMELVDSIEKLAALQDLQAAVTSLRPKLETVQPEGMRPSDILAAAVCTSVHGENADAGEAVEATGSTVEGATDTEVLLSQAATSQRSILLWDEIRTIVEAMSSPWSQLQDMGDSAIRELGIDNLDDDVIHRLCINEIFVQEKEEELERSSDMSEDIDAVCTERTKPSQLSYQTSLALYRVLFCRKALHLKSIPSRLFLDAILHASKAHGRAIVDGVLIPVVRNHACFSKLTSELAQKVIKEQIPATVIHFLSNIFDAAVEQDMPESREQDMLDRLPVLFVSEIHLATVQTILGYSNVPCPLPTRLWARFNLILDVLWTKVASLVTSEPSLSPGISIATVGTLKEAINTHSGTAWILRMYCPSNLWDNLVRSDSSMTGSVEKSGNLNNQGPFRLSNPKLVQLLMTWTIRQGPLCPDVENLQRLREFCANRLDIKQAKGLVTKLDIYIKKKRSK
ncbi:hypothetical protein BC939DRAFT_501214 [Gamsiella multidivaricata]|uniref:uncharacterized protein n=1 Tax=Gamsiella multidivaricata TaxID=101098 RepID=UPI00221ED9E5|nr:uncharacterized protein BC939DRAFT_501214 [Gamsiella multidivaricata]KAG0359572.1 hypothetical protein BGZ54_009901 [Gamsiella multidivaricata]KAI7827685.1 hypothetical protein BC939DRAFT_501214 [Gamsiella multidivaricata]